MEAATSVRRTRYEGEVLIQLLYLDEKGLYFISQFMWNQCTLCTMTLSYFLLNVFVYNKSLSWTFLELLCFIRAHSLRKDLTKRFLSSFKFFIVYYSGEKRDGLSTSMFCTLSRYYTCPLNFDWVWCRHESWINWQLNHERTLKQLMHALAVITVEPADKTSFVYNCMKTRLKGQYNWK